MILKRKKKEEKITLKDVVDERMRTILSLFVAELNNALYSDKLSSSGKVIEVRRILHQWKQGCNLNPQKVKTIPKELSEQYMLGKVGFDAILEFMEEK